MSNYEPGKYEKDGVVKTARSRREAVALSFEGFRPVKEEATSTEQADAPAPTVSGTSAVPDETKDESALVTTSSKRKS